MNIIVDTAVDTSILSVKDGILEHGVPKMNRITENAAIAATHNLVSKHVTRELSEIFLSGLKNQKYEDSIGDLVSYFGLSLLDDYLYRHTPLNFGKAFVNATVVVGTRLGASVASDKSNQKK